MCPKPVSVSGCPRGARTALCSLCLFQAVHEVPGQHCVQSLCLFQDVYEVPGQHCVACVFFRMSMRCQDSIVYKTCLFQDVYEVPGQHCVQNRSLFQAVHEVPAMPDSIVYKTCVCFRQHCVQNLCLFQAVHQVPEQHCVQSLCLFQALHEVPAMPDSILYKAIHLLDLCLHFGPKTFPNVVSASAFQFKSLSALLLPWPRPGFLL